MAKQLTTKQYQRLIMKSNAMLINMIDAHHKEQERAVRYETLVKKVSNGNNKLSVTHATIA